MDDDLVLQAESLVAVLGIKYALRPVPVAPSDADMRRAAKLPEVIKRRVAELVSAKTQEKKAGPPELPDYWKTHESLTKGVDGDKLAEVLVAVSPELQPLCAFAWTRGVEYLNSIFPRRIEQRLTGPYLHEASGGEWGEFGWAWRIANAPMFVLDLAAEGMLIGAEVNHFKTMFPSLYAEVCTGILDALADKIAADKDWQPKWWLRKQLCCILQISPVSPTLLADIEAAVKQSQSETKTRTSTLKPPSDATTASQALAENPA